MAHSRLTSYLLGLTLLRPRLVMRGAPTGGLCTAGGTHRVPDPYRCPE